MQDIGIFQRIVYGKELPGTVGFPHQHNGQRLAGPIVQVAQVVDVQTARLRGAAVGRVKFHPFQFFQHLLAVFREGKFPALGHRQHTVGVILGAVLPAVGGCGVQFGQFGKAAKIDHEWLS